MKSGWEPKSIGELTQTTETINPLRSPASEYEYVDVSSVSNLTFQIESTQRFKGKDAPSRARRLMRTNDVIVATVRPTLRRIAIVPERLDNQVCSTGFVVLRPSPELDHRFLYYALLTERFSSEMEVRQKGASYPAVTDGDVKSYVLDVPTLPVQRSIVDLLDEAFAGAALAKAHAERNLQNARELFQSHIDSVFNRRGNDWTDVPLGDVCEILDSLRRPITKRDREPGNVPYYGATGIQDRVKDFIFDEPLVLVGEDGAKWGSHERTAYAISGRSWVNNHAHVLRPNRLRVLDNWLIYFLNAADLSDFVSGLTVPKLNQGNLRTIPIALPPIELQATLALGIERIDAESRRLESLYRSRLDALDELKKSLLHQAFSGQL